VSGSPTLGFTRFMRSLYSIGTSASPSTSCVLVATPYLVRHRCVALCYGFKSRTDSSCAGYEEVRVCMTHIQHTVTASQLTLTVRVWINCTHAHGRAKFHLHGWLPNKQTLSCNISSVTSSAQVLTWVGAPGPGFGTRVVVLLAGNPTRLDGAAGLAALVWTPSIVL
jgi:hypothetical protein